MDQARFLEACRWALSEEGAPQGIGTLGEKALHRAVKYYFQPDSQQREVPVPPYVADAVTPEGILEVQTRSFRRLRPKLQAFLSQGPVTVVYPVPAKKTVAWLTEEGEVTPPSSPRRALSCRSCTSWGSCCSTPTCGCAAAGGGGVPPAQRVEPGQKARFHPL